MSKARDLANASTALSAVTATELGYVDGVTSAIQTQIDSKIGSASAINPTIVDAKGDIIAATAADTVARLAVGSNDAVLTADSSTATGLKWATVSAGPGNLVQIATGTLSGTSVSITGLSSYTNLYLHVNLVTSGTASNTGIRINNNSGNNYSFFGGYWYDYYQGLVYNVNTSGFYISRDRANGDNIIAMSLTECKNPGYTAVDAINAQYASGINATQIDAHKGYYKVSEAVSSIQIFNPGGYAFTGGTYTLLGA